MATGAAARVNAIPVTGAALVISPWLRVGVVVSAVGVRHVVLQPQQFQQSWPVAAAQQQLLRLACERMETYLQDGRQELRLPLDLRGYTAFQCRVWTALTCIPAGNCWRYGQLARFCGCPGGARAIGQALGRNPLPLVLPCHRIVASGGRLGGFSGPGLQVKARLMQHEGCVYTESR